MTDSSSFSEATDDRDLLAAMAFCWADMLLEVDENGYILFVAGATESLLGCHPDRLIGEALEKLVVKSERPLIRAYLHSGPGLKRLEELDLDFQLIDDDGTAAQESVPLSLSGYQISDPVSRYYLAARHRAIRPRARSGLDCLILQNAVSRQTAGLDTLHTSSAPGKSIAGTHSQALVVLENLAALRTRTETDATNELSRLIGIGSTRSAPTPALAPRAHVPHDKIHPGDEPMIELERRIVAYASALRTDLVTPPQSPDAIPVDDETLAALEQYDAITRPGTRQQADDMFGHDYDHARNIHQMDPKGIYAKSDSDRKTNLTRAVAYALNRMQLRSQDDLSAERLSASLPHLIQETLKSVRAFREIVENGSFKVALQPIVRLDNRSLHHFEALARFDNACSPLAVDQIIHFAEGTGLITEFDLAMCRKVLEHITSHVDDISHPVAVNLSGHSLEQPDFMPALSELLESFDIAPGQLLFEVTETSRIRVLEDVNACLQQLRQRGHAVCLDDFGAGAANFEYLSALDVDVIKFDGGAMRTALANPKGRAFIRATALLCRDLGIHTIAEMIHDQASYELVRDLGIDYGQGYHLGPPETIDTPNPNADQMTHSNTPGAGS